MPRVWDHVLNVPLLPVGVDELLNGRHVGVRVHVEEAGHGGQPGHEVRTY